ncbi:MAG: nucleotide-binding protein [Bryobacteraceae bacterium]
MTSDALRKVLNDRGVQFTEKPVQNGLRFDCASGETFNVFETGKMSFQRKQNTPLAVDIKALYEGGVAAPVLERRPVDLQSAVTVAPAARPVFIVYGHDLPARDQLELILHRMGLEPIILGNLAAAGDTIIEKLERYLGEHGNIGFGCVLLTPDDEGYKAGKAEEKKYRARQNVVLELGMVLARLGRRRVAILHKQSIELPSDIAGLLYIPFIERVEEVKNRLYTELRNAGYNPDPSALN